MPELVLATHNAHKVDELRVILGDALEGITLRGYDGPEPVEDGDTFAANALIKARAACAHTGLAAIADDSGISVAALGGAPGVHSARYAQLATGQPRDDGANLRLLLAELEGATDRRAEFVCAAALVLPDGFEQVEIGLWPGTVLEVPEGDHGFGYDPIFRPDGVDGSSAVLTPEEKNALSHRGRAFRAIMPLVRERLFG